MKLLAIDYFKEVMARESYAEAGEVGHERQAAHGWVWIQTIGLARKKSNPQSFVH